MNKETFLALEESITRWDGIASGKVSYRARTADTECPLCRLFNNDNDENSGEECEGCPVFIDTGYLFCEDTPFQDYVDTGSSKDAKRVADFLRSLRQPKHWLIKKILYRFI